MPINKHRIADSVVLLLLAGMIGLYCLDAARASWSILNLILVLPVTVIVLILCLIQFVLNVPRIRSREEPKEVVADVLPVAGLFAAYIVCLPWLGFDLGTCLFIAAFLWRQGERRWAWLAGYSISFAVVVTWFFASMLPYPMPMLILDLP